MSFAKKKNSQPIYWVNTELEIIHICYQIELSDKYNIPQSSLSKLKRNEINQTHGWQVLSKFPLEKQREYFHKFRLMEG